MNDWVKDRNFVKLQSKIKNESVPVIRGKKGQTQSVNIYKLVVGDVILLETGCRIPADCILIDGNDMTVDEKYYYPDVRNPVRKEEVNEDNFSDNRDPFLLSNTLVSTGSGVAVVCAVG